MLNFSIDRFPQQLKRIILTMIIIFLIIGISPPVKSESYFTQEEKEYIRETNIIKAVSLDGVAPHQYTDEKGEIRGISIGVLEEISKITGLIFDYKLYNSIDDVFKSDYDMIFGISPHYAPNDITLSKSYLKTGTILYINDSLDTNRLEDKIYAAIKDGPVPIGVNEEKVIYYNTREESLDAVERGEADYGYGNAYSVAFYTLQNNYRHIVTIPNEKEPREYCIGVPKDNSILMSIINKSIESIDENKMQNIILDTTSQIDRKISFSMIIDAYGREIFIIILTVIVVLIFNIGLNVRAKNDLKLQNKRYELLSSISNEYLYEYYMGSRELEPSEKFIQLFETEENLNEVIDILKTTLFKNDLEGNAEIVKLPFANGEVGVFKTIKSNLYDDKGKIHSIIGKLIDISEEAAEKQKLITKSQIDGLTGLYNNITIRELVGKAMINKDRDAIDVFIMIDCDKFKNINDTLGHLIGDEVLKNVSKGLKATFRETDIIGRIGGDEFCIYMKKIPSVDFVSYKCGQLNNNIQKINQDFHISVSIGVAFLKEEKTYEDLFRKADEALYQAKRNGGGQVAIYQEGS